MELCCFDEQVYKKTKDRDVYLVRYSKTHILELCAEYDISHRICGIIDVQSRLWGKQEVGEYEFQVYGEDKLALLPDNVVLLIACYRPDEAFRWLESLPSVRDRFAAIYFYPDKEFRYDMGYREKYKNTPLSNIIMFYSGLGISSYSRALEFSDNARALFEYMLRNHYNETYRLVWLVKNPAEYSAKYRQCYNVKFLAQEAAWSEDETQRDEYYENLCLAKFIFFTDACAFVRNARSDQIRVQLWHGQGFKACVMKENDNATRYEYMVVSSKFYADLHAKIFGLKNEQMIISGLPKEDWLFHTAKAWKERFRIPMASKYVFWLPTFRKRFATDVYLYDENIKNKETGLPVIASIELLQEFNSFLRRNDVAVVIKCHPNQDKDVIIDIDLSNVVLLDNDDLVDEDIQVNELLGHADALISDYSSVAVDYMLLDRPIAFTLDDYDEFYQHRGFVTDNIKDYLPGEEIYDFTDLKRFIQNIVDGVDTKKDKRRRLNKLFHSFFDGGNSKRLLEILGIKG